MAVKCARCKRDINRGTELQKAVTLYQFPKSHPERPGEVVEVGFDRDDKTPPPGAQLIRMEHYKCFRVAEKRENRGGDAVKGRGMGNIPTAYEIQALTANADELAVLGISEEQARQMNTKELSDRVVAQRAAARSAGTGVEDWKHQEKVRAEEHGGPYVHAHTAAVAPFKLEAHLLYAHGVEAMKSEGGRKHQHQELHARMAQEATRASRSADPGHSEAELGTSDWRDQAVVEVGDV